jgi:hypothetical protein
MRTQLKSRLESWIDCDAWKDTLCLENALPRLKTEYANVIDLAWTTQLSATKGRKWCSRPLDRRDDWVLAEVAIAPNETIPLHDHPGSAGAHLVLAGSVFHYQFTILGQNRGTWILQQERLTTKRLSIGDVVAFANVKGNVHSFVAGQEGCVLLGISGRASSPRYWYCPTNDIQSHTLAAIRIKR